MLLDTAGTANTGAWKNYTVTVPAGKTKMTVTMTGSNGDADLYIKKAAQPTLSSYDFRPYLDGSNEIVVVNATTTPPLSSGTWYIAVNGYSTATYTLKAVVE
jgi:serine protease